jgi:hypothetical protein
MPSKPGVKLSEQSGPKASEGLGKFASHLVGNYPVQGVVPSKPVDERAFRDMSEPA